MNLSISELFSVKDKVALVTGGSRGIGEMIAAGFMANGVKVYISSRKADACDETSKRLTDTYGGECIPLPADLSQMAGIQALADAMAERESKLDILVNNAGVSWGAKVEEFPEAGWDKVMDTNVKGVFFLTQKVLPLLKASGTQADPARVLSIGSVDGLTTSVFDAPSYGASKAAVHHLTRFMAKKLTEFHINFNNIAPGPYPTWMLSTGVGFGGHTQDVDWDKIGHFSPIGRLGTPEDIAGLALFLCSRAGAYIVGETIASDGGIVATK